MKVVALKKDKRYTSRNDKSLGIQAYGEANDYPQQLSEVLNASGTGKACVIVYSKFISGRGFSDNDFFRKIINTKGHTNDYILSQISNDLAEFGGFSIHLNYNANFQITEIQYLPFETARFKSLDDNGNFNQVAIHPDWGKRFTSLRRWSKDDIQVINFFNPDPEEIQKQVDAAGGWHNYKGQVFYYSNNGDKCYPLPIYDARLTDMNTEEGIANVSNRNARNNFLAAGMLIDKVSGGLDNEKNEDQQNDTEKALLEFQGDEKACKIMYIQIESDDEKPEFVSFKGTNYDKEFNVTEKSCQNNIGKAFNQPPILRAEDVGANFGADLIKNAYDYYNSVVENERLAIERVFTTIFTHWYEPTSGDYSIIPLSYDVELTLAERLGDIGFNQLIKIIESTVLNDVQKRNMAKRLFDLTDEELNDLIPIPV